MEAAESAASGSLSVPSGTQRKQGRFASMRAASASAKQPRPTTAPAAAQAALGQASRWARAVAEPRTHRMRAFALTLRAVLKRRARAAMLRALGRLALAGTHNAWVQQQRALLAEGQRHTAQLRRFHSSYRLLELAWRKAVEQVAEKVAEQQAAALAAALAEHSAEHVAAKDGSSGSERPLQRSPPRTAPSSPQMHRALTVLAEAARGKQGGSPARGENGSFIESLRPGALAAVGGGAGKGGGADGDGGGEAGAPAERRPSGIDGFKLDGAALGGNDTDSDGATSPAAAAAEATAAAAAAATTASSSATAASGDDAATAAGTDSMHNSPQHSPKYFGLGSGGGFGSSGSPSDMGTGVIAELRRGSGTGIAPLERGSSGGSASGGISQAAAGPSAMDRRDWPHRGGNALWIREVEEANKLASRSLSRELALREGGAARSQAAQHSGGRAFERPTQSSRLRLAEAQRLDGVSRQQHAKELAQKERWWRSVSQLGAGPLGTGALVDAPPADQQAAADQPHGADASVAGNASSAAAPSATAGTGGHRRQPPATTAQPDHPGLPLTDAEADAVLDLAEEHMGGLQACFEYFAIQMPRAPAAHEGGAGSRLLDWEPDWIEEAPRDEAVRAPLARVRAQCLGARQWEQFTRDCGLYPRCSMRAARDIFEQHALPPQTWPVAALSFGRFLDALVVAADFLFRGQKSRVAAVRARSCCALPRRRPPALFCTLAAPAHSRPAAPPTPHRLPQRRKSPDERLRLLLIQLDEKVDVGSGRHRLFPGILRHAAAPSARVAPPDRYHYSGVGAAAATPRTPAVQNGGGGGGGGGGGDGASTGTHRPLFSSASAKRNTSPRTRRGMAETRARQRVRAARQQERASAHTSKSGPAQLKPPWCATAAHSALVELDAAQEEHLQRIFVLHCDTMPRHGVSKAAALGDGEDALLLSNHGFYKVGYAPAQAPLRPCSLHGWRC